MRCIIVDDEPLAREGMELNIKEVPSLELTGQFPSAVAANHFLSENEVDLIFLDIEMPGLSGLDFIKSMREPPLIILTTAYPEYAIQGFELDVVDYLVKPVRLQRFIKAVNRARELYELRQTAQVYGADNPEFIYIKSERKYVKISLSDIIYIQGMKDYVQIKTKDFNIMSNMNIKTTLAQLDQPRFVRISKSYIINADYIEEVNAHSVIINGEEIPVGKTYRQAFFNNYVKEHLLHRK